MSAAPHLFVTIDTLRQHPDNRVAETWLSRLARRFKAIVCAHDFRITEIRLTGIQPPPYPAEITAASMDRWARQAICGQHPFHTHRVACPCSRCGVVFYAHCGLDLFAGRGTSTPPKL